MDEYICDSLLSLRRPSKGLMEHDSWAPSLWSLLVALRPPLKSCCRSNVQRTGCHLLHYRTAMVSGSLEVCSIRNTLWKMRTVSSNMGFYQDLDWYQDLAKATTLLTVPKVFILHFRSVTSNFNEFCPEFIWEINIK